MKSLMLRFDLRLLPLTLILIYFLATLALFFLGPLDWPIPNPAALTLFLAFVLIGIGTFYLVGAGGEAMGTPFRYWRTVIIVGAFLSIAILFPSAYFYAGKMPWQVIDAFRDQNAVYDALQKKLAETAGERTLISIIRAITFPAIFAVVPLGILNWRVMTWKLWLLVLATALSSVIFSVLRGTDREVFDVIIIISASILVLIARWCVATGATLSQVLVRRSTVIGAIVFLVVAGIALSLFADRRAQRTGYTPEAYANGTRNAPSLAAHLDTLGGWRDVMCIRDICLDPDHPLVRYVDAPKKYALLMLTSYLTQGYYGLSLAMTEDFHSTLGAGHSPVIARTLERLMHDNAIYEKGYTFRLRSLGWSDESQWATIFPWLANDVGFPGAIAVICLFAFLWGRSWLDAVGRHDDRAAIVFCLLFQLFVYVPANNQLAQTFDAYFTLVGWCAYWLISRTFHKRSGVNSVASQARSSV
jgi:hypothetical protein